MIDSKDLERYEYIFGKIKRNEELKPVQIANHLSCHRKTVVRDFKNVISVLFESPIEFCNRVWIVPKPIIDIRAYTPSNLVSIALLLKKAYHDDLYLYEKTIELFDFLQEKVSHSIYKQNSIEELLPSYKEEFYKIKDAIEKKQEIKFSFHYDDNIKHVQPLKITNLEQYWYLFCYDLDVKSFRTYHFKGIKNINLLANYFELDEELYYKKLDNAINAYFNINDENKVLLRLEKAPMKVLKRRKLNSSQEIKKDTENDGKYLMSITVSNLREISPLIQQWIPLIEVVKPEELKTIIRDNLKKFQI